MKTGILTFHDGINHGGFLQAHATSRFLQAQGHDARVIHYHNPTHFWCEYRGLLVRYNPRNIWLNLRKIIRFRRSLRRMPLTPFTFSRRQVARLPLDVVVVGSDIIWNYLLPWLGRDPIFFGEGLERFRRVSYAASCGAIPPEAELPERLARSLAGFHALSVRDRNSLRLIEQHVRRSVELVVDPTLLVDFTGEESTPPFRDRYLLVYAFALRESEIRDAQAYARAHGLKTVAVGYRQNWCDLNWIALDPFEWMGCFRDAAAVLTSTFHGTLFSLKHRKTFVTSDNRPIHYKTGEFLDELGLRQRLSDGTCDVRALFESPIDYEGVNNLLAPLIARSRAFLAIAVGDEGRPESGPADLAAGSPHS